jgi:phospholipase C
MRKPFATTLATLIIAGQLIASPFIRAESVAPTVTPIKHVVVIFGENVSFDHYFGSYPIALNPGNEPNFAAAKGTPSVNGLSEELLYHNPNSLNTTGNGAGAINPFRLDRSEAATADQDHEYTPEQQAFNGGLMDAFPEYTGTAGLTPSGKKTKGLVMGYYDGNTVTALWNYAQKYALNDNSFGTTFGPSLVGAINLISGQTDGVSDKINAGSNVVEDGGGGYTLLGDGDPIGDVCSTTTGTQFQFTGENIGDLLTAHGVTWGWFQGGFNLSLKNANGTTGCERSSKSAITKSTTKDYVPHHEPFQFYKQTANLKHLRPSSVSAIGVNGDPANHQYDLEDFYAAASAGNLPAVSFLKAASYQDAHAGYSDPLDEQAFITQVVNLLQTTTAWESTAVIIAYDDSDGWYDHQMSTIVNPSASAADRLNGEGKCGTGAPALPGPLSAHAQGRCGNGPRLPLLVISPYAKANYVDHTMTDQTSIIRFIEDNWLDGERIGNGSFDAIAGRINNMFNFSDNRHATLVLNETTGEPMK